MGAGVLMAGKSELDMRQLAESYGLSYDEAQAIPELRDKLKEAVRDGWNATKWNAWLKNSKWWRSTSDAERKYIDLRTTDPSTWKQKWNEYAFHVNQLAMAVGAGDLSGKGTEWGKMNWYLQNATWAAFAQGWSDDRIKAMLASQINVSTAVAPSGEAGRVYNQLMSLAYTNGRTYQSSWYQDQLRKIQGGSLTIEQVEAQIRKEAASDYGAFSEQILAGQNAMDLAAPYAKTVAQLLEIPDGSFSLNDPLMRKAMTTKNKDGSAYGTWQLENDVRNDVRWKSTDNARESLMKVGHDILSTFGKVF